MSIVSYIVHDAAAAEVDEETFYHLHQSGGTKISSALHVCEQLLQTLLSTQRLEYQLSLPVFGR